MKEKDKTKEELINELLELRQRVTKLEALETECKRAEDALRKRTHDLRERVKELNFFFAVSELIEKQNISLEEIFQGIVNLIPPAWQYAEITCARITVDGQEFRTENFRETFWKLARDINLHCDQIGLMEVCYLEERPEGDEGPFQKEERSLINAIAERLGKIIERKRGDEALKDYSERLEEMVGERTKELRDAQEELVRKEKLAILGQLAAGVGHELRNPLGVISNAVYYLETILSDADETTKEYLELISSEVRTSEMIVSDLLDLSRTRPAERERIEVFELITQILDRRNPPEGVEVDTQITPDLRPLFVDPRQTVLVFDNLITNAYQAMTEGGKLTIQAKTEEDRVHVSITDTGCGIPKENMEKLFEPLFTTKAKGIGLGLAVSKNLVEANRGSIEVVSEEDKGSTFTIILPTKVAVS